MDFSFTETMTAVADLARKIFADRVTPATLKAAEAEPDRFMKKVWRDLAGSGLLGVAIPESEGGAGHGFLELCALLEQAGAAVAPLPLWPTLVLGALPLAQFGTPEQKKRFLPRVASGDTVLTAALLEPTSDDPTRPETKARATGSAWSLTGTKTCVPAAHLAERVLVPARTDDGAVGVFLVDPRAEGVKVERQITTTGDPLGVLTLWGTQVAADDVLCEPTRGSSLLQWLVPRATAA